MATLDRGSPVGSGNSGKTRHKLDGLNSAPKLGTNAPKGDMMQTYESMEVLGEQADSLNNLLGAMELPFSPSQHMEMLRPAIFRIMEKLREVYVIETGDNPWL